MQRIGHAQPGVLHVIEIDEVERIGPGRQTGAQLGVRRRALTSVGLE